MCQPGTRHLCAEGYTWDPVIIAIKSIDAEANNNELEHAVCSSSSSSQQGLPICYNSLVHTQLSASMKIVLLA